MDSTRHRKWDPGSGYQYQTQNTVVKIRGKSTKAWQCRLNPSSSSWAALQKIHWHRTSQRRKRFFVLLSERKQKKNKADNFVRGLESKTENLETFDSSDRSRRWIRKQENQILGSQKKNFSLVSDAERFFHHHCVIVLSSLLVSLLSLSSLLSLLSLSSLLLSLLSLLSASSLLLLLSLLSLLSSLSSLSSLLFKVF